MQACIQVYVSTRTNTTQRLISPSGLPSRPRYWLQGGEASLGRSKNCGFLTLRRHVLEITSFGGLTTLFSAHEFTVRPKLELCVSRLTFGPCWLLILLVGTMHDCFSFVTCCRPGQTNILLLIIALRLLIGRLRAHGLLLLQCVWHSPGVRSGLRGNKSGNSPNDLLCGCGTVVSQ